jgi:hypothetical protein
MISWCVEQTIRRRLQSVLCSYSLNATSSGSHCVGSDGHWKLEEKLYFNQRGARVSAADYHAGSGMLVVAFTNGIFDLYELPAFQNVHTLSVTRERISSAAFNAAGNWVSLRCSLACTIA